MQDEPELIKWDKSYEIGHELIDSQHHIFVMLLNKLSITVAQGVSKDHLFRILNELKKYAEFHFLSEENVMYECQYPGLNRHEHIHSNILIELSVLAEHLSQERAKPEELIALLRKWLFDHILNEDSHIAQYVRDHQTKTDLR